jgi:hypothetical protein
MDTTELTTLIRRLADEMQNVAFMLNPEKTTPVFGDLHDYFTRLKADSILPSSFETHVYLGGIHSPAREAARDLMSMADLTDSETEKGLSETSAYLSAPTNPLTVVIKNLEDLLEKLPSIEGAGLKDLNPYKRAALGFKNNLSVIRDMLQDIKTKIAVGLTTPVAGQPSEEGSVATPAPVAKPVPAILYDEKEVAYLRKMYTAAEFIISRNISVVLRKKYMDVELFESRYSFVSKDLETENEMMKNEKQFRVAEKGPFPYVTLLTFVKEFANVILLSILAWNGRKTNEEFVEKFNEMKGLTIRVMDRILAMPKTNMKSSEALSFLRTSIVPLVNDWTTVVIRPVVTSRTKYYEELSTLSRGLTNRINTIYAIEGAR